MARPLSILTIVATALSAAALLFLPYGFGAYPGQLFADAAIGWLPVWVICVFLAGTLAAVCIGTALSPQKQPGRHPTPLEDVHGAGG